MTEFGGPEKPAPIDVPAPRPGAGEAGSVFFTRPHLADYIASAEELGARAADLFAAWRKGKLAVTVDREYPLAEAAGAHRYLEAGKTKGKLLLRI